MRHFIAARGLPALLLLMAIAVILILSGASAFGFAFGLVVVGVGAVLLASMLVDEVAHGDDRYEPREDRVYRGPHARSF